MKQNETGIFGEVVRQSKTKNRFFDHPKRFSTRRTQ